MAWSDSSRSKYTAHEQRKRDDRVLWWYIDLGTSQRRFCTPQFHHIYCGFTQKVKKYAHVKISKWFSVLQIADLIPLSSSMARLPRSRLKLQIASLFCLLLPAFLLLVYCMFPCKHCLGPEKFTALLLGGLRNHQNKCEGHLRHQGEAARHRRSAAALSKKKKSKLSDRKARLVCLWCFCLVP